MTSKRLLLSPLAVMVVAACGEAGPAQEDPTAARAATVASAPAPLAPTAVSPRPSSAQPDVALRRAIAATPPPIEPVFAPGSPAQMVTRDRGAATFFRDGGFAVSLPVGDGRARRVGLHWSLVGARSVAPRGDDARPGTVSSLVGPRARWKTNLPTYGRVAWPEIYPGIVLEAEPRAGGLEYRFRVAAGADPTRIGMRLAGVEAVSLVENGAALALATELGPLREDGLRCFQDGPLAPKDVPCRFGAPRQRGRAWEYGFVVGPYDTTRPLVIDPTIDWSTYLGAGVTTATDDTALGVAVDSDGNLYVTGTTVAGDFPSTGGFDAALDGSQDAFVTKIAAGGTSVTWSTYFGGSSIDSGTDLGLDAGGNVYVGGWTWSSDFPIVGGFDSAIGGSDDAFVAKINADGASIAWSSFLGGSGFDRSYGMAVDGAGNVFATGVTSSTDFPSAGGFDSTLGGGGDAFVTKVNAGGASLAWSSYLGGADSEIGFGADIDGSGNVYVVGDTGSADFPSTGGFDAALGGFQDAFVSKVNAAGSSLDWSSYLGGSGVDRAHAVAVVTGGTVYVTGYTQSNDFPSTNGFDTTYGGNQDAFVTKVNSAGTSLDWSSYLGGNGKDDGWGIAVDAGGAAHVTGETVSADFPTTGGFDTSFGGGANDAFVTRVEQAGALGWSSYLGGASGDVAYAAAVMPASAPVSGTVAVGTTTSTGFPTTGGFDSALGGTSDAFVTKVAAGGGSLVWSSYLGGSMCREWGRALAVTSAGEAFVAGSAESTAFPAAGGYDTTYNGGATDAVVAKYDAAGALVWASFFGGSSFDEALGIAVDAGGNAYVTGYSLSTDFPLQNSFDSTNDAPDAFVTKVAAAGTSLTWSSFLGGSGTDHGQAIAIDDMGNAYVTGYTLGGTFPTTGGFDTTFGGSSDAFVAKINGAGPTLAWGSFLGGTASDNGKGIAVDGDGNVYVVGDTTSTDFPTPGGFDPGADGMQDAFVTKVNAVGSSLAWSSYLGDLSDDYGNAVAVDASGNVYVAGLTLSSNFPHSGGYDGTYGGQNDAYVTKVNAVGSSLAWSTFLGSGGNDGATAIALDADANVYVAGRTSSPTFPVLRAFDASFNGLFDAFATKIDAAGTSLDWSTYLGGSDYDYAYGIAVDGSGNTYVGGETSSTNFPTRNATDASFGPSQDIFVTRINTLALSLGSDCLEDGECDSGHCTDGVCCTSDCTGTCDRCDLALSLGTCTDDSTLCDGNCAECAFGECNADDAACTGTCSSCSGFFTTFNCGPDAFACAGNCDVCTGSGTNYDCAADAALCTGNCDVCSGAGNSFSCGGDATLCTGNCGGVGSCSGAGTSFSCAGNDAACVGNCDDCVCAGTSCACAGAPSLCTGDCDVCSGSGTAFDCAADQAACGGDCDECAGAGTTFSCSPLPDTTVCRMAAGACDLAENCTGSTSTCPVDVLSGVGTVCSPAGTGACDLDDLCTGGVTCPARVASSSTVCRSAVGDCDVAETCDGSATECPANGFVAALTPCDDGSECTAGETCASGVCQGGGPAIVFTPDPVSFPDTSLGDDATPKNVSIDNIDENGGTLVVTSVATSTDDFPLLSDPTASGSVALTGSSGPATARVGFQPTTVSGYTETLTVSTDNASCPTFTVELLGKGKSPSVDVMSDAAVDASSADAAAGDASSVDAAGTGASAGDAAAGDGAVPGGAVGDGVVQDGAVGDASTESDPGSGCGCRAAGRSAPSGVASAFLAFVIAIAVRRRPGGRRQA